MRHLIAAIGVAVLSTGQAQALSCMRPDVAQSFQFAAEAEQSYSVLMGSFRYDAVPRPRGGNVLNPEGYSLVAQFEGQGLGANGFGRIDPVNVTIDVQCFASWCGAPPPLNQTALVFVERTGDGYVLRADPCSGNVFAPVAIEDIDRVESCMRGTGCEVVHTR